MRVPITTIRLPLALVTGVLFVGAVFAADDPYVKKRHAMVEAIEADVAETSQNLGQSELNTGVMQAMAAVPRHEFVPGRLTGMAYFNRPLPIGHGQTISQPYIVALMTDLLGLDGPGKVMEVGTGSGYQAAVLAALGHEVYTKEIIPPLGEQARERLQRLGYTTVSVAIADGYYGWDEHAPFDAIVVTAAANHVPPPLIKQLKPGGRMVIPVGGRFTTQHLVLIEKQTDGTVTTRQVLPVIFVPLTGRHD